MSSANASRSSATLMSVVVTMLGTLIIRLAGFSHSLLTLGVLVLLTGLASTVLTLLRSSRAAGLDEPNPSPDSSSKVSRQLPPAVQVNLPAPVQARLEDIVARLTDSFEGWWGPALETVHLWLAFDRWLRDTLHEVAGARRIRCFRISGPDRRLVSLADELDDPVWNGASWRGLVDRVVESGCVYIKSAADLDQWSSAMNSSGSDPGASHVEPVPAWLAPIRQGDQTIGLLVAGEITDQSWQSPPTLLAVSKVLSLMWGQVEQQSQFQVALRTDRTSGVLNRTDLGLQAEKVLAEAIADEEPVVLLAVGIEGIRRLDDGRHWEQQDWLMQQVGRALRRRLRTDDIIGRFSDDRFVAVLRRLDLSLGELIAKKVLASIHDAIEHGDASLTENVNVRCGLAADSCVGFEAILGRACDALQQARDRQVEVAIHESSKRLVEAGATA